MSLQLHSEQVSPSGSINSAGILRQLGRPNLDTLAVLVRETVQNSWDARRAENEPIDYAIIGLRLNQAQRRKLTEEIFAERPDQRSLPLEAVDSAQPLYALLIVDRGTAGLAGPTRADIEGKPRNFVSFLRDVGLPSEAQFSGGTYGFGKASLYAASGLQTILVYTRCETSKGHYESRFIVSALGRHYTHQKTNYTGRHWWGRVESGIAEPILNEDADATAYALGMGSYNKNDTGTVIMILDPLFSDRSESRSRSTESIGRTPLQAMNLITEYLLCFFWPKMLLQANGKPAIRFYVRWDGQQITIPDPAGFPPLIGFVEAMERLKGTRTDQPALRSAVYDIASERPQMALGRMGLQQFLISKNHVFDIGDAESPFTDITHHTALMRRAELVVKYLEGKPFPSPQVGYSGVFITSEGVDAVYAASEPPTHDDWNPKSLTNDWHKRYVNIGLTKIREAMTKFTQASPNNAPAGVLTPLGSFATWLGESLIPTEEGPAASRPRPRLIDKTPNFPIRKDVSVSSNGQLGRQTLGTTLPSSPDAQPTPHMPIVEKNTPSPIQPIPQAPENNDSPPTLYTSSAQIPTDQSDLTPLRPIQPTRKPIRGRSSVEIISDQLVEYDGHTALLIRFNVKHAQNADGSTIIVRTQAVLDDQRLEDEPPVGGTKANIMNWISPDSTLYEGNEQIYIEASSLVNDWQVLIMLPGDMIVNVDLEARAESTP